MTTGLKQKELSEGEIDSDKRKEGTREMWEEKVAKTETISELCSIIDEIGFTEVNGKIVHPAAMKVRLEILDKFSSEGLIKWKLEEITKEFGIRDRAETIKLGEAGEKSDNIFNLDEARSKKEDANLKEVYLKKLREELEEAKNSYEKRRKTIKELKDYFKKAVPSLGEENDLEFQILKKDYEDKKKKYDEIFASSDAVKKAA